MEPFYLVIEEWLLQNFFYWYIPFICWAWPACYRVFFGDGLFFWQEVAEDYCILDYEG